MNKNVKDLSSTRGTYTKVLQDNMSHVNSWYEDYSITNADFVKKVETLIIKKAHDTNASRNFIISLHKTPNKEQTLSLVYNAYLRGCGMGANINDKFNCR